MKIGRWTALILIAALSTGLSARVEAREPTPLEQFMLELINRARMAPETEATQLYGGTINEGPPFFDLNGNGSFDGTPTDQPWSNVPGARQPVAFNPLLIDAAGNYATTLNDNNAFTHTFGGTTPESRMTSAGYTPGAYTGTFGTALDFGGTAGFVPGREMLAFYAEGPTNGVFDHPSLSGGGLNAVVEDSAHLGLFHDTTVPGRGHRNTMLYGEFTEVGVGVSTGVDTTFDSFYAVVDFAHTTGTHFLTGVVFNDGDLNGFGGTPFYTPGEQIGSVLVEAFLNNTLTLAGSTMNFGSGGYSLQLADGTYDLRFTHASLGVATFNDVTIAGLNTRVQVLDTDFSPVPEPGSLAFIALVGVGVLIHRRRRAARVADEVADAAG